MDSLRSVVFDRQHRLTFLLIERTDSFASVLGVWVPKTRIGAPERAAVMFKNCQLEFYLLFVLFCLPLVYSANITWTGSDGNWEDAFNWSDGVCIDVQG